MVGLTSPSDTKVMNAPAPPLIAPDSVRERLVDIMNNVFTLVVCLGLRKSVEKLAQWPVDGLQHAQARLRSTARLGFWKNTILARFLPRSLHEHHLQIVAEQPFAWFSAFRLSCQIAWLQQQNQSQVDSMRDYISIIVAQTLKIDPGAMLHHVSILMIFDVAARLGKSPISIFVCPRPTLGIFKAC